MEKKSRKKSFAKLIIDIALVVLLVVAGLVIYLDRTGYLGGRIRQNEAIIELSSGSPPYVYRGEYDYGSKKNPDGILKIRGRNTEVIMDGRHEFSWLAVEDGARLTQKKQEEGGTGLTLLVRNTLRIDEESRIDLEGSGFSANEAIISSAVGDSPGDENGAGGGGAAIVFPGEAPTRGGNGQGESGGEGGFYAPEGEDQPFVFNYPGYFGSGGGEGYVLKKDSPPGGHGGGLLTLACENLVNFGKIILDGENGGEPKEGETGNGGGSGGSLYIRCGRFENNGEISSDGGLGSVGNLLSGGGGSGGSIIIYYWQEINKGIIRAEGGDPEGTQGSLLFARGSGDVWVENLEVLNYQDFIESPFEKADANPFIYPGEVSSKAADIILENKIEGENLSKSRLTFVFGVAGDDYAGNNSESLDAELEITFSSPVSTEGLDDCSLADARCFVFPALDLTRIVREDGSSLSKSRSDLVEVATKELESISWQVYDLEPGRINYYWLTVDLARFMSQNLSVKAKIVSSKDEVTGLGREEIDVRDNVLEKSWNIVE